MRAWAPRSAAGGALAAPRPSGRSGSCQGGSEVCSGAGGEWLGAPPPRTLLAPGRGLGSAWCWPRLRSYVRFLLGGQRVPERLHLSLEARRVLAWIGQELQQESLHAVGA